MFSFITLLILILRLIFFSFAQELPSIPNSWDLSAPIIRPNGRIMILNRNLGDPGIPMVDFHIAGIIGPVEYLEFQTMKQDGKDLFALIGYQGKDVVADPILLPGRGEFKAIWANQGTGAVCHLERNNDAPLGEAVTKSFTFMPGGKGGGLYVWPCVDEWIKIVCVGNKPSCAPEDW